MKKLLTAIVTATGIAAGSFAAGSWTSGACTVTLADNGTLTVSGSGAMADYASPSDNPPWFSVKNDIKRAVIESGVTKIGNSAFIYCDSLVSATIQKGVTKIGKNAFENCSALTSVTIPEGLTNIGGWAFRDCFSLPSLTIPASVTAIDIDVFDGCRSMANVYCHADPDALSWYRADTDFMLRKATKIHVKAAHLAAYKEKFGYKVNATFVGDLDGGGQSGGGQSGGGQSGGGSGGSSPMSCYEVLNAGDITAAYSIVKAVTLQGVVYDNCDVVGIVELKLGKVSKGKSKVSGSFTGLDGKKITIKAVTVGDIDGSKPATVSLEVKGHGTMTVTIGGDKFAGSLGGRHVQSGTVGGNWTKGTATVTVNAGDVSMFAGRVQTGLLPNSEQATAAGGKWSFAKAAGVKWAKPKKGAEQPEEFDPESGKGLIVDTSKGANLSGLKLTYTPKKGTFKGSFKVYALEGEGKATKLKKYTVNVTGVVVGGVGYGVATCKKPAAGPWTVTVE